MKLNQLKSGLKGLFAVAAAAFGLSVGAAELPEGYTVVDYIVAPRDAYIDTGYEPSDKTHVAMDVTVQGAREYWFGAWTNNWDNGVYALGNDNGEVYCGYGSGRPTCGGIKVDDKGLPNGRVTVALEKGVVYTNGVVWSNAHSSGAQFTVNYNLYLFAQNRKGTATPGDGQGDIICHGCTISEGSVVKRDFVPCVRRSDLAVGLYDLAASDPSKAFYTNAGSGKFGVPEGVFCSVTVGDHPNMTAAYTFGDGSVTNAISGTSFTVLNGTMDVKVIFMAKKNYVIEGGSVVELEGAVTEDVVFGEGNDYAVPNAVCILGDISYLDWDEANGTMTNATIAVVDYELVTSGTRTFADGKWYVVADDVAINDGGNITVSGSAHLILCDGASLTVTGSYTHAGIDVRPGESLTIYGQRDGTGRLMSTGGNWAAGIGGGDSGAGGDSGVCGTVTINGGTVTAQGGVAGAGIGGGYRGMGGMVTINGGTVTATGGSDGAGIGVRDGYEGAGIGGGGYGGAGGTVTINGGMVNAIAGERAARIGHGESGSDDGTIDISGGVFAWKVSDDWCKKGTDIGIVPNLDPATRADYPWAALPSVTVTVGEIPNYVTSVWTFGDGTVTNAVEGDSFKVLRGTESVKVIFTLDPAYESVSGKWVNVQDLGMVNEDIRLPELPASRHRAVEYVDADGKVKTNDTFSVVTAEMDELSSGWWLVEDSLSCGDLYIAEGHEVHLILADGASLTATAGEEHAGIRARGATLVIYGQRDGSGILTANGGNRAAGIGGGFYEAGGTVTINGGTVTAIGGEYGAGIGGGGWAAGGTVTINGGTVTATGGSQGAGIGGGAGRAGGTVMINGGTVTAKGGDRAAGIGGGMDGAGDTVTINGGRVNAIAGESATRIGCGAYVSDDGTIEISGGVFAWEVNDSMCAIGYCVVDNSDPATTMDYPWKVVPSAMVTIGGLSDHATAVWTSGDGTVTNAVKNGAFAVLKGTENVKVIFTADPGYSFAGGAVVVEVFVGRVDGDCSVAAAPETQKSEIETFGSGWYVKAANGAYVDTGLNARSDTKIVADMQALDLKGQCGFFGTIGGDMNLAAYINGGNPGQVATCLGKETDWTASGVNADTARHLFVLDANNNGSFTIDGTNANCRTGNVTAGSASTYPILVGARNNEGTSNTMNCRIFSFQIYEGTELKRDLIPARTKDAGQVVGLCDTVSGEFFAPRGGALTLDHDDSIALASFCDYDANSGSFTNAVRYCTVVTSETRTFEDGQWYVVADDVEISNGENITVSGSAHLILCDGASLTVNKVVDKKAAIGVSARNSLTIYGQENGSGLVTVTGGSDGAGIGGGDDGAGGTVTINGGSVTATGGQHGAGIGGGHTGAGGEVTINGGIVTAAGGHTGAGIGGGFNEAGGTVTINGGKVSAIAGELATRIGRGAYGRNDGTIEISGGVFAWKVSDDWCAEGHGVFDNPDPVSATDYPWTVVPSAMVAIGGLSGHETAVWTSGDGTVTNAVKNGAFAVVKATENVKVIFTADPGHCFAGGALTAEVPVGRVEADCTVTAPETRGTAVETFGRGWYVTATNGVYVDTLFKPGSNTRVEMDVLVGNTQKREYWFGCWTNDWNNGAFALGNDYNNKDEVYCGYGSGDSCGSIPGIIPSGRVTVALEKGIVYTNGVVWSDKRKSDAAFLLDQNLYLFAQNRKGTPAPGDGQERIVCYGCKISTNDANGVAVPVRNLVPARTKDAGQVVGLYDTVSGEFFGPRVGALTLGHDEDAAVSVTPGEPLVFDTAAEATNAAKNAVLTPRSDVEAKLGKGSDELETYCNMFGFDVVPTSDGKWAVEAFLLPPDWTNVVESAQAATRQIPVAELAAWQSGDDPIRVPLTNCVPGFYYSLYYGASLTNFTAAMEANGNVLCGTDREVVLPEVTKPIGGQDSGFFTIGVLGIPTVYIPGTDYTITGGVEDPFKQRRTR